MRRINCPICKKPIPDDWVCPSCRRILSIEKLFGGLSHSLDVGCEFTPREDSKIIQEDDGEY